MTNLSSYGFPFPVCKSRPSRPFFWLLHAGGTIDFRIGFWPVPVARKEGDLDLSDDLHGVFNVICPALNYAISNIPSKEISAMLGTCRIMGISEYCLSAKVLNTPNALTCTKSFADGYLLRITSYRRPPSLRLYVFSSSFAASARWGFVMCTFARCAGTYCGSRCSAILSKR